MKGNSPRRRVTSSARAKIFYSSVIILALVAGSALRGGVQAPVTHAAGRAGTRPVGSDAGCPACAAPGGAKTHLLAATYYSLRADLRATLMLNNKGPQPLDVQPTIFSLSGARRFVPAVTLPGNSFRELDLRALTGDDEAFREGSVQVTYSGPDLMLGAQVYLSDAAHSLVFEEKLAEPAVQFASGRLESVWWLPTPRCAGRLVVSNTADAPLTVTARADGTAPPPAPREFNLAAHETRVLDILADLVGARGGALAQTGGVSLTHNGAGGALLARLYVEDAGRGYSSWARFTDPAKGKSVTYQGAGLRLGAVAGERLTPVVVARNVGTEASTITGRIPYTLADGSRGVVTLPALRLAPGAADTLELTAALARGLGERDVATAGLELEHTGAPGSVLLAAQSVSQSLNHVFQVPLWDLLAQRSATGGYPWVVEGDTTTVVYIKNATDRPQQYVWQLNYAGADGAPAGIYAPGLKTVAAGQTVALDLRALRDRQVPDGQGRTIPPAATHGQLQWSVRGPDSLALIGRAEQVDAAHATATSYACQNCCQNSFYDASCTPFEVTGFPGDTTTFVARERTQTCYGQITEAYDIFDVFSWGVSNPAVASVDEYGFGTALAPGATWIQPRWYAYEWDTPFAEVCRLAPRLVSAFAFCDVLGIDLTIDPGEVRPAGTGGTNTATVIVRTTPTGVANVGVTLRLLSVAGSGGHVQHNGAQPLGTLAATQGVTDANGEFRTTYTAPLFGGDVNINAAFRGVDTTATVRVVVPNLSALGAGDDYNLIGATATHPDNHYGTATALSNLPLIASDYKAQYYPSVAIPAGEKLSYNDMSLVFGGKFDIYGNWSQANVDHAEHRVGINCDVRSNNVPQSRWGTLTQIFADRGSPRYLDETGTSAPHWHLRFE